MAASFTKVDSFRAGNRRFAIYDVTLDSSYTTGGYAITAQNLGGFSHTSQIKALRAGSVGGYTFSWDTTNKKLLGYVVPATPNNSAQVEVPSTTDLHTVVVRVEAILS